MKQIAPLLVVGAGVCWGLIGLFSRSLIAAGLSSPQITLIRCLVIACSLALFLLFYDRKLLRIRVQDLWLFLGSGLLSIAFFNICYFMTIKLTSLAVAAMLLYAAPCIVTILSAVLFHERMTSTKLIALGLSCIGCALVVGLLSGGSLALSPGGILIGLGSAFGYALYSIFGTVALRTYHPLTFTFWTFLIAALGLLPLADAGALVSAMTAQPTLLLPALSLGLISSLAPFLLYTKALEFMEPGRASILTFVEPMVATLCGILIFHEPLTPTGALGIALIFGSVLLLGRAKAA
ncbi:MAG: DMT family transporter [Butyricicoccaceae bacterium]